MDEPTHEVQWTPALRGPKHSGGSQGPGDLGLERTVTTWRPFEPSTPGLDSKKEEDILFFFSQARDGVRGPGDLGPTGDADIFLD